jgi:general nucleoside transport system ATP-binding protein
MLTATAISKRFGRNLALDGVDFCARAGEIHALVGENGAGKSTLINIFAGRLRPDGGHAALDGDTLRAGSPHAALRAGIAAVYQSPMLFERMTWEENLALGGFGGETRELHLDEVAAGARALAGDLGFELPSAGTAVEECSVAERVRLEIIRALSFDPRVLILDEPTGVLAPGELAAFLDLLRRLRAEGRIVVIVTHKLAEALAVADRVTVLRHGRLVAERNAGETSEAELALMMIGELAPSPRRPLYYRHAEAPVLEIESLMLERDGRRVLDGISLTVRAGEIDGIAGVDGNGQTELVEIMAGVRAPTAGRIQLIGRGDSGPDARMAIVPQNRDLDGLILEMPLWENLMLAPALRRRFSGSGGWLSRTRAAEFCADLLSRFRISAAGPFARADTLSGGNRQRLVVARALATAPKVLVAHDICRGLDLRAIAEVHRMLREYAAAGGAVLLISGDLDELLALCGLLWVMSRGRLTEVAPENRNAGRLGLLMSGAAQ